jgi:hypothetical protein
MPHTGCGCEILDCFAITVAARSTLDLYANMQQVRSLNSMHIVYYPGAHYYYHRYYCGLDECGLTYIRQATHAQHLHSLLREQLHKSSTAVLGKLLGQMM